MQWYFPELELEQKLFDLVHENENDNYILELELN